MNTACENVRGHLDAYLSRELQEETLAADQKKLELGVSTIFVVVTDQQALSAAAAGLPRMAATFFSRFSE